MVSFRGADAIKKHFKSAKPNPESLARWALRLPARDETQPVFRAAIELRLRADPDATREWAESLPAGWHREQALEAVSAQ
ncbi:hypothetical protein ACFQY0_12420 [Haloferula chungangensis]|uniref:Uncharacterized protein n=1 Tax=Haloferula chungangensis TaxID=1048331 RepID=A0ABW2L8K2_9BACT